MLEKLFTKPATLDDTLSRIKADKAKPIDEAREDYAYFVGLMAFDLHVNDTERVSRYQTLLNKSAEDVRNDVAAMKLWKLLSAECEDHEAKTKELKAEEQAVLVRIAKAKQDLADAKACGHDVLRRQSMIGANLGGRRKLFGEYHDLLRFEPEAADLL